MAIQRQRCRRRYPNQSRPHHGHDREKSDEHAHENRRRKPANGKRRASQKTLNRRDEQRHGHTGEDQVARFAEHFVLKRFLERKEMPNGAQDLLAVTKNKKQREEQDEEIHEEREEILQHGGEAARNVGRHLLRALL